MRKWWVLGVTLGALCQAEAPEAWFGPGQDLEKRLLETIHDAGKTIDVAMYTLSSTRIMKALEDAQDRGVRVRLLLDRGQLPVFRERIDLDERMECRTL